ncbi:MAG: multicopper oxidase family protein [Gammaproteobacteria bacterium]|nr:multicopper oxidase family protein [Gammaproteobacteria bacterium]
MRDLLQAAFSVVALAGFLPGCAAALAPQQSDLSSLCSAGARGARLAGGAASPVGQTPTDLFCFDLHATAAARDAWGVVELGRVPGPFGVTVTAEGNHVSNLTAWISGLPDPSQLGPFEAYVAWATTPTLDPMIRLGPVGNGRNPLGRVSFNKFLIMVTAEASASATEREGRLVLRGRSPSSLMEAHDLLAQAPEALRAPEGMSHDHAGGMDGSTWSLPPMYPGLPMLPGIMALRPRVDGFLPEAPAPEDLPPVRPRQLVRLGDGGTLDLEADFVRRDIGGRPVVMLAFNGQQPGPLIQVPENATIFVNFTNRTPLPTAIHWHGIRLDNRFDGVPGVTQDPVEPGETFRYQIHFPDAGIYWYHPHHREDIQQEMGLYGNLLVDSPRPDYYGPANQEQVLMLDDLLLGEDGIVPFGEEASNYALMGRFGNILLVNGEPDYALSVRRGEVVRFFLTNVSNTRTFNLSFARADESSATLDPSGILTGEPVIPSSASIPLPVKVVASDVGRFEREVMSESVVISPAERYVVEVRFDEPGEFVLANRVQAISHREGVFLSESRVMGRIVVDPEPGAVDHAHAFATLRENADVAREIDAYREQFDRPVDHSLDLTLEVEDLPRAVEQSMLYDWVYFNPVEWSGTMPVMNWASDGGQARWILRESGTARENMDISWRFRVGDVVKIRLHNDRNAFHAMQHPLHIHGQRFLVLSQNGVANDNLVWKDTVLLPTGSTTDILLELSNPGRWMVHCHIAEHIEAGMKFVFEVEP